MFPMANQPLEGSFAFFVALVESGAVNHFIFISLL